ncbi:MAG TPA: MoxR family ATPase [Acidimicrobiia bacterium]|nr:MoxR family ATPase [Acidimicrobiia bacterium]
MTISAEDLQGFRKRFDAITDNIERVIQGKRDVIELMAICLISGGHALVEDVPGVGKTLLAKSLARSIDCSFSRIQFTPDLLPSDVTGVSVWDRDRSEFVFRRGPVFANVVLGDEINRASPKTQSALLEAMEERQVTVDGITRPLTAPFLVLATQNPIEHEGTYPLPEAQLDRFMMRLAVGYPAREKELQMLDTHGDHSTYEDLEPVVHADDVLAMVDIARRIHVADVIKGYLVDLADMSRNDPDLLLGISPRATLYLLRAARSHAAAGGRDYVAPDDVKFMLKPVLNHRLILRPEAQMRGVDMTSVVENLSQSVPVPGTKPGP